MKKGRFLYEGKAKKIYETDHPGYYWIEYKDDATAFDGLKKGSIAGKGVVNNRISAHLFQLLEEKGIRTHFVELVSDREMIVKGVKIIPLEVVVRNIAAGSLSKRLGLEEGKVLPETVVEFYYKNDDLHDPLVNSDHIKVLGLATPEQVAFMRDTALKVNNILRDYLAGCGIDLVDYKLEFGTHNGEMLLADEISPDTCRFWDHKTKEKLDKDRFRRDLGNVEGAYAEVLQRLLG
ncbi:MAG: phosphoribosylaminoimidazolesuccinocarboxamide synthase [Peptococcaceae bacterium]|nr:phosphoribosylaminoimidazolesuccinocarboxamide synthase [Peptococcaceae bacterium]